MMLRLYDLQSSETETMRVWFPCLPSVMLLSHAGARRTLGAYSSLIWNAFTLVLHKRMAVLRPIKNYNNFKLYSVGTALVRNRTETDDALEGH